MNWTSVKTILALLLFIWFTYSATERGSDAAFVSMSIAFFLVGYEWLYKIIKNWDKKQEEKRKLLKEMKKHKHKEDK